MNLLFAVSEVSLQSATSPSSSSACIHPSQLLFSSIFLQLFPVAMKHAWMEILTTEVYTHTPSDTHTLTHTHPLSLTHTHTHYHSLINTHLGESPNLSTRLWGSLLLQSYSNYLFKQNMLVQATSFLHQRTHLVKLINHEVLALVGGHSNNQLLLKLQKLQSIKT